MRIVGIDPGLRNFGYAIVDNGELVEFDSICIWDMVPKNKRKDYAYIARTLVDNTSIFDNCDVVLIERQMQSRMKLIACALRCFFWEKSYMLAPIRVKKHFKISMSDYKKNKKASIQLVPKFFTTEQLERFQKHKKKDDIADAVLMAMYWHQK
jgi:Holliday junction resolvasome RuvABC endonuclease subunit